MAKSANATRFIWTCLSTSLTAGGLHRPGKLSLGTALKAQWDPALLFLCYLQESSPSELSPGNNTVIRVLV